MFGRGKKILEDGAQANAVCLDSEMGGRTNSHGERHYKVSMRVQFEDGETQEVTAKIWRFLGGAPSAGDIIPVRYDPEDRSKVEVDIPAMDAGKLEAREDAKAKLIQASEQKLARGEDS